MSRNARNCINTTFFHIMVQGLNKEYIFNTKEQRNKYLEIINKYKGDYKARLAAESDPEIKKIKKAIEHQKDCNRFIQLVLEKNIGSFGFDIKNAVDMIKIEGM